MNDCKNIEFLIYLYRDGELSSEEQSMVVEHTKTCQSCSEILKQLQSIDAALTPLRKEVPVLSEDTALVNDTINRIAGTRNAEHSRSRKTSPIDGILRWLQPALGFALAASIILFVIQQSRDAIQIADLENSLHANGNTAMAGESLTNSIAQRLLDLAVAQQKRGNAFSSPVQGASAFSDPAKLISSGVLSLLRNNNGVFDEFARRYPELTTVTLDDGIDEREQKILDTEGRAFIKDFEKLLREGKQR
jgi:hypothetical protein